MELLGVLRRQRTYEIIRLKLLDQLARARRESPLAALLLDAAVLHTRANLELLDRAEQRSADLSQTLVRLPTAASDGDRTQPEPDQPEPDQPEPDQPDDPLVPPLTLYA